MKPGAAVLPGYNVDREGEALWVFLEHREGALEAVSREILGQARWLADEASWSVVGLACGQDLAALGPQAVEAGADEVYLAEHPLLADFPVDGTAAVVSRLVAEARPSVFLAGATLNGRDLAGRLAVRLHTGLNADCTDIKWSADGRRLVCEVTGFGGGVLALLEIPHARPQMATVRQGVFQAPPGNPRRKGTVVRIPIELSPDEIRTKVVERRVVTQPDLTQARVLVCGGRGVRGDFDSLRRLAELLGGEVGATRPAVDEGWVERERQIGQTGLVCRPKVALAIGLSGAFHFLVGIERADLVIAVNSDPEAPIFEACDFGAVADAARIIPALLAALQAEREGVYA